MVDVQEPRLWNLTIKPGLRIHLLDGTSDEVRCVGEACAAIGRIEFLPVQTTSAAVSPEGDGPDVVILGSAWENVRSRRDERALQRALSGMRQRSLVLGLAREPAIHPLACGRRPVDGWLHQPVRSAELLRFLDLQRARGRAFSCGAETPREDRARFAAKGADTRTGPGPAQEVVARLAELMREKEGWPEGREQEFQLRAEAALRGTSEAMRPETRPDPLTGAFRLKAALLLGAGVFSLLLALFAFNRWRSSGDDALARARRTGVIRIGYAVEAPYAFLTPDGKVTGESPEIARVIAARLGIPRVEWRLTEFGDLLEGLEARRFDVVAAGMFITPEREEQVAFSVPTFQVDPALLVRKGNPLALHSYADVVQKTNARVAVLCGSVEEARLRQLGCPNERLLRVPDALSGRAAVRDGQADALALSAPTIRWMVLNPVAGLTEMAPPLADSAGEAPSPPPLGGFTFRKDESALQRAWNDELVKFVGSEEHRRIVSVFGFTAAELPPSAATGKGPKP